LREGSSDEPLDGRPAVEDVEEVEPEPPPELRGTARGALSPPPARGFAPRGLPWSSREGRTGAVMYWLGEVELEGALGDSAV